MRLDAPCRMQVFFHGFPLHAARRAKAVKTHKNQTKTQRFPRKQKAIQKDYTQMELRKEERKERIREKIEEKNSSSSSSASARVRKSSVFHLAGYSMGLTEADVDEWLQYQDDTGWRFITGAPVTALNFRRSMRMWRVVRDNLLAKNGSGDSRILRAAHFAMKKELAEAKRREEARKRRDKIAASQEGWVLCAEECAHCDGLGCSRGIKIPPAHQSWPKPPRECPAFKAKEVS